VVLHLLGKKQET